jgi:hypothetical protein
VELLVRVIDERQTVPDTPNPQGKGDEQDAAESEAPARWAN